MRANTNTTINTNTNTNINTNTNTNVNTITNINNNIFANANRPRMVVAMAKLAKVAAAISNCPMCWG